MKHANVLISLCLILAASAVIAYVYISPKGSEGSSDLEERVENIESRLSEQLVLWFYDMNEQTIMFGITHIGTANVTISEILVNNVLNSSSPGWVGNRTLIPGQMGQITLYGLKYFAEGFTDENDYFITVTTTRGNMFYLRTYPLTFTFMTTEELRITGVTFQTGTATISVKNAGTSALSISSVTVDDVPKPIIATGGSLTGTYPGPYDLVEGASGTITISFSWTSGNKYTFAVITNTGNKYAYTATATP